MNISIKINSLKAQAFCLFAGKTVSFLLNFSVPLCLVRVFDKNDYGFYQLAIFIAFMSIPILGLGLNSSLYYFYPIAEKKKGALLAQTVVIQMAVASIIFIAVLCLDNAFVSLFRLDHNVSASIVHISLLGFFLFLSSMIEHIFIIEKKAILNLFYLVGETTLRATLIIAVALSTKNVVLLLESLTFFYSMRFLFLLIYLICNYRKQIDFEFSLLKDQLRYSLPFGAAVVVSQIGQRVDKLVVSTILGISQLATYSVATVFKLPLVDMYFDSLFNVTLPKISNFAYQKKKSEILGLLTKILDKTIPVTIPLVLFFELFAEPLIVLLFTDKYLDAVNLFRIALFILVPRMFGRGLILRAYKQTHVQFKIALIQLTIALIFGILFTTLFGAMGAVCSYCIAVCISYYLAIQKEADLLGVTFKVRINYDMIKLVLKSSVIPCLITGPILFFKKEMHPICFLMISTLLFFSLVAFCYHKSGLFKISIHKFNFKKAIEGFL